MKTACYSLARWRERAGVRVGPRAPATIAVTIVVLLALAACGKKGSPVPPGPSNEIVFPKTYPSR